MLFSNPLSPYRCIEMIMPFLHSSVASRVLMVLSRFMAAIIPWRDSLSTLISAVWPDAYTAICSLFGFRRVSKWFFQIFSVLIASVIYWLWLLFLSILLVLGLYTFFCFDNSSKNFLPLFVLQCLVVRINGFVFYFFPSDYRPFFDSFYFVFLNFFIIRVL